MTDWSLRSLICKELPRLDGLNASISRVDELEEAVQVEEHRMQVHATLLSHSKPRLTW